MKICDWCQTESVRLTPVENHDSGLATVFAWICQSCSQAMKDEFLYGQVPFRFHERAPLRTFLEVAELVAWVS
jgi:hypothetical protein